MAAGMACQHASTETEQAGPQEVMRESASESAGETAQTGRYIETAQDPRLQCGVQVGSGSHTHGAQKKRHAPEATSLPAFRACINALPECYATYAHV